jgi:hypothetical protein
VQTASKPLSSPSPESRLLFGYTENPPKQEGEKPAEINAALNPIYPSNNHLIFV